MCPHRLRLHCPLCGSLRPVKLVRTSKRKFPSVDHYIFCPLCNIEVMASIHWNDEPNTVEECREWEEDHDRKRRLEEATFNLARVV